MSENDHPIKINVIFITFFIVFLFAGDQISRKFALQYFSPLHEGAIAFTIGFFVLIAYGLWKKKLKEIYEDFVSLWRKHVFSGFISFLLNIVGLYGVQLTLASRASVFIYTYPFFVAIFGLFGPHKQGISIYKIFGLIIAFIGVFVIFIDKIFTFNVKDNIFAGDMLMLLSAALLGFSVIYIRNITKISGRKDSFSATFWQVAFCLPWFWLFVAFDSKPMNFSPGIYPLAGLLYHGLIFTIAVLARANLVSKYNAVTISSFFFLTPGIGVFLSFLLLNESLNFNLLAGSVIIGIGILFVYYTDSRIKRVRN